MALDLNFPKRLEILQNGLTQRNFALKIGIPLNTYTNWLSMNRTPSADAIVKICTQLGISSDWLLGISADHDKILFNAPVSNSITASPNSQVSVESTRLLDIIEKQQATIERQQDTILQLTDKISSLATSGKE